MTIRLSDLLVNLRKDLDSAREIKSDNSIKPKYKISTINVEIYVEKIVDLNGSLDIQIVNLGANTENRSYHKICIELKPINK